MYLDCAESLRGVWEEMDGRGLSTHVVTFYLIVDKRRQHVRWLARQQISASAK